MRGSSVLPGLDIKNVRGDFQPLVSEAVFDRVQVALRGGRKSPGTYQSNNPEFPLRGFVECGKCGLPLTGSSPKGRSLEGLQRREALLDEGFLFARSIDNATYERQRDKVREEIALARIELEDANLEEIDLEGVLKGSQSTSWEMRRDSGRKRGRNRNADYRASCSPKGCDFKTGNLKPP